MVEELVPGPSEEALHRRVVRPRSFFGVDLTRRFLSQIAIHPGRRQRHPRSERVTGRRPSERVPHAAPRPGLASPAFGLAPIGRAAGPRQSGRGWATGRPSPVTPAGLGSLGAGARKPLPTRFSGASEISPL